MQDFLAPFSVYVNQRATVWDTVKVTAAYSPTISYGASLNYLKSKMASLGWAYPNVTADSYHLFFSGKPPRTMSFSQIAAQFNEAASSQSFSIYQTPGAIAVEFLQRVSTDPLNLAVIGGPMPSAGGSGTVAVHSSGTAYPRSQNQAGSAYGNTGNVADAPYVDPSADIPVDNSSNVGLLAVAAVVIFAMVSR